MVLMRNMKNDPIVIIKYPLLSRTLVLMKGHIYTCNDEANKKTCHCSLSSNLYSSLEFCVTAEDNLFLLFTIQYVYTFTCFDIKQINHFQIKISCENDRFCNLHLNIC